MFVTGEGQAVWLLSLRVWGEGIRKSLAQSAFDRGDFPENSDDIVTVFVTLLRWFLDSFVFLPSNTVKGLKTKWQLLRNKALLYMMSHLCGGSFWGIQWIQSTWLTLYFRASSLVVRHMRLPFQWCPFWCPLCFAAETVFWGGGEGAWRLLRALLFRYIRCGLLFFLLALFLGSCLPVIHSCLGQKIRVDWLDRKFTPTQVQHTHTHRSRADKMDDALAKNLLRTLISVSVFVFYFSVFDFLGITLGSLHKNKNKANDYNASN